MDEEKFEKNIKIVNALIEKYVGDDRRDKIIDMLNDIGENYFSAPASSNERYHSAYPGGLVDHSLGVYKNLLKLNDTFKLEFTNDSMVICSLFHDLGKAVTTNNTPYYVLAEEWKKEKHGKVYDFSDDGAFMPNQVRSVYLLQKYQIPLEPDEFLAIYLNDGQYVDQNKIFALKEPKLALYLHIADRIALEEERI